MTIARLVIGMVATLAIGAAALHAQQARTPSGQGQVTVTFTNGSGIHLQEIRKSPDGHSSSSTIAPGAVVPETVAPGTTWLFITPNGPIVSVAGRYTATADLGQNYAIQRPPPITHDEFGKPIVQGSPPSGEPRPLLPPSAAPKAFHGPGQIAFINHAGVPLRVSQSAGLPGMLRDGESMATLATPGSIWSFTPDISNPPPSLTYTITDKPDQRVMITMTNAKLALVRVEGSVNVTVTNGTGVPLRMMQQKSDGSLDRQPLANGASVGPLQVAHGTIWYFTPDADDAWTYDLYPATADPTQSYTVNHLMEWDPNRTPHGGGMMPLPPRPPRPWVAAGGSAAPAPHAQQQATTPSGQGQVTVSLTNDSGIPLRESRTSPGERSSFSTFAPGAVVTETVAAGTKWLFTPANGRPSGPVLTAGRYTATADASQSYTIPRLPAATVREYGKPTGPAQDAGPPPPDHVAAPFTASPETLVIQISPAKVFQVQGSALVLGPPSNDGSPNWIRSDVSAPDGSRAFRLKSEKTGDYLFIDGDTLKAAKVPPTGSGMWKHVPNEQNSSVQFQSVLKPNLAIGSADGVAVAAVPSGSASAEWHVFPADRDQHDDTHSQEPSRKNFPAPNQN